MVVGQPNFGNWFNLGFRCLSQPAINPCFVVFREFPAALTQENMYVGMPVTEHCEEGGGEEGV